jgi:hypothetical protein
MVKVLYAFHHIFQSQYDCRLDIINMKSPITEEISAWIQAIKVPDSIIHVDVGVELRVRLPI